MRQLPVQPRWIVLGAGLLAVLALVAFNGFRSVPPDVPTGTVEEGEFLVNLIESGELHAVRSMSMAAPQVMGKLQIVSLIKEGTEVTEGDLLIQFDTNEMQKNLQDHRAEVAQVTLEIEKREASLAKDAAQHRNEVARSRLTLQRAQIDNIQNERIVSKQTREKNALAVEEAELNLADAEKKLKAFQASGSADLEILKVKRAKAQAAVDAAQRSLDSLTLEAPIAGLVVLSEVWSGGEMAKVKEGDSVWPGQKLLNLPDLSEMEAHAQVSEVDIGRVQVGQEVLIRLDAYPDPQFTGRVQSVGRIATTKERGTKGKVFDLVIGLDRTDRLMRPGMSVSLEIIIERLAGVRSIPREAVFRREGRDVVYLQRGQRYEEVPVSLGVRNDTRVVVKEGLEPGQTVYLLDPTVQPDAEQDAGGKSRKS